MHWATVRLGLFPPENPDGLHIEQIIKSNIAPFFVLSNKRRRAEAFNPRAEAFNPQTSRAGAFNPQL